MRRYKCILTVAFGKPWNNGWFYKAGFEKNGHEVIPFDPGKETDPEGGIRTLVNEYRPDFILHTKDELPAQTFQDLRKLTKVVMWYPDSVIPASIMPYISACDVLFTMSEGHMEEFRQYNPDVYWLTQAFEPSLFSITGVSDKDKRMFASDVAFVGTLGSKDFYLVRRAMLQRIIREGFALKWWGPRLPRKLSTVPLLLGRLGRSYGGRFVWGEEYAKVAQLSKIFIAFDAMPHVSKSMSARMYTAVGCGAFYMCRHVKGIEEVLEPGREIITFHSENEMIDMIRYFLENEELRVKIAKAGQKRVLSDHTYEVRARQMMEILEKVL